MNGDFDCFDENDDENEDSHQKRIISTYCLILVSKIVLIKKTKATTLYTYPYLTDIAHDTYCVIFT